MTLTQEQAIKMAKSLDKAELDRAKQPYNSPSNEANELKRIAKALERLADFFEKHHTPIYEDEAKVMDV